MRCLLFVACCMVCCGCATLENGESGYQSWLTDPRYSLFPSLPNVAPQSTEESCKAHSRLFLSELRNKTLWAVRMWDSSAKAPVGVISGSIFHFGNFDECLKTAAPFPVQFCVAHIFANISAKYWEFSVRDKIPPDGNAWSFIAKSRMDISKVPRDVLAWGLCAPASCKSFDLQMAINVHLISQGGEIFNQTSFGVMVDPDFCTKATDRIEFTPGEIAFWVVLLTLILLTTSGTLMDILSDGVKIKQTDSNIYKFWMCFSIKQNYKQLIPESKPTKNALDAFHGMKFVSILFILFGHRIGVAISLSTMNYDVIEEYLINGHKMFFVHTDLVVDTFFFISGLLGTYIMMDVLSKRFVNPVLAILVRLSRLAPLYFFMIWFQSTAAFRMGSGPLWQAIAKNETEYCVDHWWANVFFFSNYYKTEEMCLPHSWFLPCELHFFTVAAIMIPIIVKYPTPGKVALGILTLVSAVIPSIVIYVNKVQPLILFYYEFLTQPRRYDSFNVLYIKSHNRATVYLMGMAIGIYLHYKKDSKTRISKKLTFCGVLAWFAFLFAPMAYGSLYYDLNKSYNAIEAAIFGSLRRVSWGIGLSIFILAHRFGTIPLVDFFFSSRLAVFCSKITYGVYLIHFNIITTEILKTRSAKVFSVPDVVVEGIGDALKSIVVTLVCLFILELPLRRTLRELVFAKKVKEFEGPPETQNVSTELNKR